MRLKTKESYNKFIRELTSKMAIAIRRFLIRDCHRKYKSLKKISKSTLTDAAATTVVPTEVFNLKSFLSHRPFSRILEWGKDFHQCVDYVILNLHESFGAVNRIKPTKIRSLKNQESVLLM